jgi:isoleucyl-tRNA synthetase
MWVSSENYQEDLRISEDILKQLVDNYRRIRNTCRFILGNVSDFTPGKDALDLGQMLPFDRYVLDMFLDRHARILQWYDQYELHKVFHTLHNLCVNELSAFYLDILKDRLYVSGQDSPERRSAQTALFHILLMLVQDMAPILSFTAEEVYQHLPQETRDSSPTVFGFSWTAIQESPVSDEEKALWDQICLIRQEVTKAIEPKRKQGIVGHSLDVALSLYLDQDLYSKVNSVAPSLREIFILSQVKVLPGDQAPEDIFVSETVPGLKIGISHAGGQKCPRCWVFSEALEQADPEEVCPRCSAVLEEMQA